MVARTDKVRVYVDVPEMDASAVTRGTQARVRVQALGDEEVSAAVTRTSWPLRPRSRTLRAEIDLPNPDVRLLPGMYAYGRVLIDRSNVRALPLEAVTEVGNQPCCYLYKDGKAVQTPLQTGIDDGKWVEVSKKRVKGQWADLTGTEAVIVGDLAEISDGQPVRVERERRQALLVPKPSVGTRRSRPTGQGSGVNSCQAMRSLHHCNSLHALQGNELQCMSLPCNAGGQATLQSVQRATRALPAAW
jgi:hypothetical protein